MSNLIDMKLNEISFEGRIKDIFAEVVVTNQKPQQITNGMGIEIHMEQDEYSKLEALIASSALETSDDSFELTICPLGIKKSVRVIFAEEGVVDGKAKLYLRT